MQPRAPIFRTHPHLLDWEQWPRFDATALKGADRDLYDCRERAIRGVLVGEPRKEIARRVGLCTREIARQLARCLEGHSDGRIFGFRALSPGTHVKDYVGSLEGDTPQPLGARGGHSGRMTAFFEVRPELWETLLGYFLGQNTRGGKLVHESRVSYKAAHVRFIHLCKAAGVREDQYPRNTDELGRTSLRKHLRAAYLARWEKAAGARHGTTAARHLQSGIGSGLKLPVLRPYQQWIYDGHKVDARFEVEVPAPSGGTVWRVMDRLWLLAVRESASRGVLAGDICLRPEFGAADVERCLANAVGPRPPLTLTIPGLEYPPEGGMPGLLIPECAWAVCDQICFDNAWANLANRVRERVIDAMGATVDANAVGSPEARGIIERFFGILEEYGFHRLPSTTGSGPWDIRRRQPEAQARRYRLTLQELRELTAVFLARENARPQEGIDHRSPLEFLRQYVGRGGIIRQLPEERRARFGLLVHFRNCTVRGNAEDVRRPVRRPHVNIEGVPYRSDVLGKLPHLIGKPLRIEVNADDLRHVRAFLENGQELGVLTASGRWGTPPHDLTTRKAIMELRRRGMLFFTDNQCPIQVYLDYLALKAKDHPTAVNEARRVQEAMAAGTPWATEPGNPDDGAKDPDAVSAGAAGISEDALEEADEAPSRGEGSGPGDASPESTPRPEADGADEDPSKSGQEGWLAGINFGAFIG